MTNLTFRRWALALWLALAVWAWLIATLRGEATLRAGAYNVTSTFEDISIFNIDRVRHGEPAYVDPFSYPYRTSLFNWLFYYLYGAVAQVVNPSEESLPTLLRLVTLSFTLVGFAASLQLLRSMTPDTVPCREGWLLTGALAVLTWFGPPLTWWSLTVRPDLPAVVCEFLGLVVMVRAGSKAPLRAVLAGLLFFFGWSCKQNQMAMLGGTLLGLVLLREWLHAGIIGAVFTLLTSAVFVVGGRHYWSNTVVAPGLAIWTLDRSLYNASGMLLLGGVNCLAALAVLRYALSSNQRSDFWRSRRNLLVGCAFAVALLLNFLASGRRGAARNYYFESWVAGMTFTALTYLQAAGCLQEFPSPVHRRIFTGISAGLLLLGSIYAAVVFIPFHKPFTKTGEFQEVSARLPGKPYPATLLGAVQQADQPIFCDDPMLVRLALGEGAGPFPVIDYTIYLDAVRNGLITDADIATRIEQRWFTVIWLDAEGSLWEPLTHLSGYIPREVEGRWRRWERPRRESVPPGAAATGGE